jgi:hypothetical protein
MATMIAWTWRYRISHGAMATMTMAAIIPSQPRASKSKPGPLKRSWWPDILPHYDACIKAETDKHLLETLSVGKPVGERTKRRHKVSLTRRPIDCAGVCQHMSKIANVGTQDSNLGFHAAQVSQQKRDRQKAAIESKRKFGKLIEPGRYPTVHNDLVLGLSPAGPPVSMDFVPLTCGTQVSALP